MLFPVIDACLELRARHAPAPEAIDRVVVRGHPLMRERTDWPNVETGRGTPGRPMSDAELDTKVRELATYGGRSVDAAGLIAALRGIEDDADPTRLPRLTVPA